MCALRRENALAQSSPLYRKGMYLVGARKQELPGAALPWEWPAVISPDEPDLSTPGTLGAQYEAEARALYDALDKIGR